MGICLAKKRGKMHGGGGGVGAGEGEGGNLHSVANLFYLDTVSFQMEKICLTVSMVCHYTPDLV